MSIFDKLLQMKLEKLTIFYCGHGSKIGNESVLIFDNGCIKGSQILDHFRAYSLDSCQKTIIADCCNAESIWAGENLPKNTIILCSSIGDTPSKQAKVFGRDHGLFTLFFWRAFRKNPNFSIKEIVQNVNTYLAKFDQKIMCTSTPSNLVDFSMFDGKKRIINNA